MAAKRRSKAKSRRAPAKKRGGKKAKAKKSSSRKKGGAKKSEPRLSPPYARSRAAGLPPVPAGFVGAIVDSLIRNDGAQDIDVRGRDDGHFDVTRLR